MATNIAAQCYTIRDYMQSAEDMEKSLAKIAKQGWRAVQLSGSAKIDPALARDMLDRNGLKVAATHIAWDDLTERTDAVIAAHHTIGCKYIGLGAMPEKYRSSADGFKAFAKDTDKLAKKIADAGCKFIYHNHHFEFIRFGGVTGMEILVDKCAPEMQFELDTFWVQAGGGDVRAWIKHLMGRLDVIHFKDMAFDPEKQAGVFAEIGQGNLDWKRIIKTCKKSGVRWHIVEQDICPGDPFDSLKISLDYLNDMGMK